MNPYGFKVSTAEGNSKENEQTQDACDMQALCFMGQLEAVSIGGGSGGLRATSPPVSLEALATRHASL